MCDDSPMRQPGPGQPRGAKDRLRVDEMVELAPGTLGVSAQPQRPRRARGPVPVVVVCPERYGLVQHTVDVVNRFAAEGYVAISPDFYTGLGTFDPEERLPELTDAAVLAHLRAAIEAAGRFEEADLGRLSVFGVCRSGSWGLLADAELEHVSAVIALYGGAAAKEWCPSDRRTRPYEEIIRAGRAPVLAVFGEDDHTISVDDVARFRNCLEGAGRSYEIVVEPCMPHGWLNTTMPGRYRRGAAERTWRRMLDFLARRPGTPPDEVTWSFQSVISRDYDFSRNVRAE